MFDYSFGFILSQFFSGLIRPGLVRGSPLLVSHNFHMSLEVDINGGILQCYADQYACESMCGFKCWTVRTCEHRTTSNYVCLPRPQIIILSFVIWCIITIAAIILLAITCWRFLRSHFCGETKVHPGLVRSVSDLEQRVQNASMVIGLPTT